MIRKALLVGVSNYEGKLSPLKTPISNIKAIEKILKSNELGCFDNDNVHILTNPDYDDFRDGLSSFFVKPPKGDSLFLLYFSGHGYRDPIGDFYLIPTAAKSEIGNTSIDPDHSKCISSTLLVKYLTELYRDSQRKANVIIILDCCFGESLKQNYLDIVKDIKPKFALLSASGFDEYAFETETVNLSLFTGFIVNGIESGDVDNTSSGEVTVENLYDYLVKSSENFNKNSKEGKIKIDPKIYPSDESIRKLVVIPKLIALSGKDKYLKAVRMRISASKPSNLDWLALETIESAMIANGEITKDEADKIKYEVRSPYRNSKNKEDRFKRFLRNMEIQDYENNHQLIDSVANNLNISNVDDIKKSILKERLEKERNADELKLILQELFVIEKNICEQEIMPIIGELCSFIDFSEDELYEMGKIKREELNRYEKKLEKYSQIYIALHNHHPLSVENIATLKILKEKLGLREEDVKKIQAILESQNNASKESESQNNAKKESQNNAKKESQNNAKKESQNNAKKETEFNLGLIKKFIYKNGNMFLIAMFFGVIILIVSSNLISRKVETEKK